MFTFGPVGRSASGFTERTETHCSNRVCADRRELRRGPALFSNIVTGLGTEMAMAGLHSPRCFAWCNTFTGEYKREVNVFWETLATSCLSWYSTQNWFQTKTAIWSDRSKRGQILGWKKGTKICILYVKISVWLFYAVLKYSFTLWESSYYSVIIIKVSKS